MQVFCESKEEFEKCWADFSGLVSSKVQNFEEINPAE
jgi:hypothetical protein